VAGGEPLHAGQCALSTEDGEDRHKKHHHYGSRTPRRILQLGKACRRVISSAAVPIWSGLEETGMGKVHSLGPTPMLNGSASPTGPDFQ
jgi:hypothetical protein